MRQAARASLTINRLTGDGAERLVGERQIDRLHFEQPLVLLYQRVLRLGEDFLQRRLSRASKVATTAGGRRTPDQAVLEQILGLDLAEDLAGAAVLGSDDLGAKPIEVDLPRAEMIFSSPPKAPAADE